MFQMKRCCQDEYGNGDEVIAVDDIVDQTLKFSSIVVCGVDHSSPCVPSN